MKLNVKNIDSTKVPKNAIEVLLSCSNAIFPNIGTLLIIAAKIPVTTATSTSTFSTLELLKTYLRTTTR